MSASNGATGAAGAGTGTGIELGAHTLPYRGVTFERALQGIASSGFRYVGIWNDHADGPVVAPDAAPGDLDSVRRRIEGHGLTPRMAFTFRGQEGDLEAQLRRSVEIAGALGVRCVTTSGPSPYRKGHTERKRDMLFHQESEAYFATLRAVAPVAQRAGVLIAPKPHMGVTGTGADLADLVRLIDHPAVRVCYDAGNIAYYEGLIPEEDVLDCAPLVACVCVKDHRGPRFHPDFPVPGEGEVDHARIFRALLEHGFQGPCLVERLDGTGRATEMPPETIDAALTRARVYLEGAVAQATAPASAGS
jgi:sugar phosphate isomerase/epimerase